jgi:hypothetical protein
LIKFTFRKFYLQSYKTDTFKCYVSYASYNPYSTDYSQIRSAAYGDTELYLHGFSFNPTKGWNPVKTLNKMTWTVIHIIGTNLGTKETFDYIDRTKATYMDFWVLCTSEHGDVVKVLAKHVKFDG